MMLSEGTVTMHSGLKKSIPNFRTRNKGCLQALDWNYL